MLADLRTGTDRRPGIDHRALANIGAEIDKGRHQDRTRRNEGGAADDAVGHGAETGLLEFQRRPAVELGRHLVHQLDSPGPPLTISIGLRRKERSTAFFSH